MKIIESDKISIAFLPKIATPDVEDSQVVHNKHARRNSQKLSREAYEETILQWQLARSLGLKQEHEMEGFCQGAANELANGLSSKLLLATLHQLDTMNGYCPEQQDCLYISLSYRHPEKHKKSRPYIGDYLAFIFDQQWKIATGYEGRRFLYAQIMEGYIEIR